MNESISSGKLNVPIKTMTLEKFIDAAKTVADEGLEQYCSDKSLKSIWENSDYREYTVILNTQRINQACIKQKRMESMFPITGINLGSRDLLMKKDNYEVTKVRGQRSLILRTDVPKIVEATVWGHGPGDRGEKVPIPFWADCQFMAVKTEFKRGGVPETGTEIAYLEGSTPISRQQLYDLLATRAVTADMLDESFRWQPVVLRGKIGTFKNLARWKFVYDKDNQPVMDPVKDKFGVPVKLPNGNIKMQHRRVKDEEGFPCIQGRIDNAEEEIYTFAVTVGRMDKNIETNNVVTVKFLNKKLAQHFLELNSHQRLFRDAFAKGIGTANDAFDHLTNTYRGTEVFVVGVLTRYDDKSDTVWIDVEGTMLLALNMDGTEIAPATESPLLTPSQSQEQPAVVPTAPAAPVTPTAPAPVAPSVPDPPAEIVAESVNNKPASAPVPDDPVEVSAPVPEPAPTPPMAIENSKPLVDRLDAGILETMEMFGKDKMTFEEFEDFGLCPPELIGVGNKMKKERVNMVKMRIAKIRKDQGESEVGSYGDTRSPTSVSTLTPEEAAKVDVQQECSACREPMLPTPHGHWEVCKENPKNKEKKPENKEKASSP